MAEEAMMTGDARAALWALVSMFGFFTPLTAAVSSWALVVKFCLTIKLPPKSTTAISRSGPAPFSINFVAAARAWIWSGDAMEELSKKKFFNASWHPGGPREPLRRQKLGQ